MNNINNENGRSLLAECGTDALQSGRSMIEMLGVLAIIGVLSVGGIAGYSKAMLKYRVNKTIEQITLIAGNVRSFFAPQRSYEGLGSCNSDNSNCKLIKKAKLMPDEMWDDTAKQFKNVFGYYVQLYTAPKSTSGDKQAFKISYALTDNMEACIELVTYDWANAAVKTIMTSGPGGTMYLKIPIDIAIAPDFCAIVMDNYRRSGIGMDFYFDIDLNSSYWNGITWSN